MTCFQKYIKSLKKVLKRFEKSLERVKGLVRVTVLCKSNESEMREFRSLSPRTSEEIRPKIQASFRNVLSVISLKQRTKIRRIFMTRTKFP